MIHRKCRVVLGWYKTAIGSACLMFCLLKLRESMVKNRTYNGVVLMPGTVNGVGAPSLLSSSWNSKQILWSSSDNVTRAGTLNGTERGFEFISPFIWSPGSGQREGQDPGALASPNKQWTYAVVWPCTNGSEGCFVQKPYPTEDCPQYNCQQIFDLEKADVVVFNVFRMLKEGNVPSFVRPPGQLWVMMTIEAPIRRVNFKMLDLNGLRGVFNMTQTFRLDSDILNLYGQLERVTAPVKNYDEIFNGKTTVAAWFVSNCDTQSLRHLYAARMMTTTEIHVFGACGNYNCSAGNTRRDSDDDVCFPLLSKNYFFYLSFENSICQDYVTEKFFKIFQDVDIIPVVRGGTNYKRYFPPNTFIDTADFTSPESLASYLVDLSKDKARYTAMLIEKAKYRYHEPHSFQCALCERLQKKIEPRWYPDTRQWFVSDQCRDPRDL